MFIITYYIHRIIFACKYSRHSMQENSKKYVLQAYTATQMDLVKTSENHPNYVTWEKM